MRRLPISYPYGGTFVNDYFGEHLDSQRRDRASIYEGAAERELQALLGDVDDATEIRMFVESQTRSRRNKGTRGVWS